MEAMKEEEPAAAFGTWDNEQAAGGDLPGALVVTPPPPTHPTNHHLPPPIHSSSIGKHHSLAHLHCDQVQQAATELTRWPALLHSCVEEGGV